MTDGPRPEPKRAVMLLSGGLDSTLAAKMMADQGIELFALHFTSPFCTCSRGTGKSGDNGRAASGCHSQARVVADRMGIPIRTVSKGSEYIEVVRNPRHGRGAGMNPCIDCRIFTLRKAKEYMEEIGASFIVTGEVLGQRPMSQRGDAMRLIEKRSGTAGLVVRPLSARHCEPTVPEREGWVDRERLLDIVGRSRKEQMRLAREWNVGDYPCPAGGCLLTDRTFSLKVRDLLEHSSAPDAIDLNLLKVGRHFRMEGGAKVIVARDEAENRRLEALCRGRLPVFIADGFSGPSVAVDGTLNGTTGELLSRIYTRYGKPGTPPPFRVREVSPSGERELSLPADPAFSEIERALIC
jgi:tRNA U34 2-thiouridine synthase MnmA/TrmU